MGPACLSVPIRKGTHRHTQTSRSQISQCLLHDSASFVPPLYTCGQILPQNHCSTTGCVYMMALLTQLFVSVLSSDTPTATKTKQLPSSPPSHPSPSLLLPFTLRPHLFVSVDHTLLKEMQTQAAERAQFPKFTLSLIQHISTTLHTHYSTPPHEGFTHWHLQHCILTALTWARILHDVLSSSMGVQCVARPGLYAAQRMGLVGYFWPFCSIVYGTALRLCVSTGSSSSV